MFSIQTFQYLHQIPPRVCTLVLFINDLLKEVEEVEIGIQLSSGKRVGGLLFSNDCIGVK